MRKIVLNAFVNFGLLIIFVLLANKALSQGLEETLVSLALIYGIVMTIVNAFFVAKFCKK